MSLGKTTLDCLPRTQTSIINWPKKSLNWLSYHCQPQRGWGSWCARSHIGKAMCWLPPRSAKPQRTCQVRHLVPLAQYWCWLSRASDMASPSCAWRRYKDLKLGLSAILTIMENFWTQLLAYCWSDKPQIACGFSIPICNRLVTLALYPHFVNIPSFTIHFSALEFWVWDLAVVSYRDSVQSQFWGASEDMFWRQYYIAFLFENKCLHENKLSIFPKLYDNTVLMNENWKNYFAIYFYEEQESVNQLIHSFVPSKGRFFSLAG